MVKVPQWLSVHPEILMMLQTQMWMALSVHTSEIWIPLLSLCDWYDLCDHLKHVPWEDIFQDGACAAVSNVSELELVCISLMVKMKSSSSNSMVFSCWCRYHSV